MDIATLGVNIKYDSVKQAGVALDKFSQSGEKAEKVTDKFGNALTQADQKLGRFIDAHGRMREANGRYVAGLSKATNETNSLSGATDKLRGLLQLLAFGTVATQAIKVADAYTQMQSKLRLVTQSTQELLAVQSQLNKVAVATFAEQGAVTELYAKMQPALAAMGKSTQDTVAFVEKFNKALALTNPSTAQAQAAILQFSQAMGSGVLRGDEFNSMMENANGVMQKLALGMGLPIGALREMAHEGKLTADVVYAALNNATESINSDFDKMALTVSNASQTIETGMFNLVGAINNATGATRSLAEVMHDFGQVLNIAANYVDIYAQASAEAEAKTKGMSGILDTASQSATNLHDVFRQVASVAYDVGTGIDMIVLGLGGLVATMASVGDSKQMQIVLQDTRKELDMIIKRNSDFKESLNIKSQTAKTVEGLKSIDDELKDIFGSSYEAEKATIKLTGSTKESEKASKAHAKTLKEQAKAHLEAIEALDKQVEAISKAEQSFRKYLNGSDFTSQVDELNEVTKAWKVLADNGLATTDDLQKAIDAVTMERFGTESQKAAEKMVENIDYAAEAMKASIKRLDDAFADVWRDIFNGAEDFGSSLRRWFTSLLAELAHAAITKPIVISMSGAMGMGSSGIASASGGLDIVGNIGNIFSSGSNIIGTVAGTAGTYLGAMGAGAGSAQAAMLASQSGAFGMQGAALTTQALGASGLSSAMSAMASAAPYIAAALVIDQLTGGAIGTGIMGGARGERTRALNIGIANGQVSDASNIYRATHYDAGWGRSGSWNVDNLGGAEFNATIKATVNAMASSIRVNAEKLGYEFNEGFSGQFDADLFGKTAEETQQIIADTFIRIGQSMVDSIGGLSEAMDPLQQSGEQTYETLARVIDQFDAFNYPIGRLNDSLATLNLTTLGAVDSLVTMAGGMQNLQAMQSNFINAFYTDSQKAELTAQTVSSIFESIGMSVPASREALVGMVQALDLTTEAGQRAYVALTGSTATLDTFFNNIERQAEEAAKIAERQAEEAAKIAEEAAKIAEQQAEAERKLIAVRKDALSQLTDEIMDKVVYSDTKKIIDDLFENAKELGTLNAEINDDFTDVIGYQLVAFSENLELASKTMSSSLFSSANGFAKLTALMTEYYDTVLLIEDRKDSAYNLEVFGGLRSGGEVSAALRAINKIETFDKMTSLLGTGKDSDVLMFSSISEKMVSEVESLFSETDSAVNKFSAAIFSLNEQLSEGVITGEVYYAFTEKLSRQYGVLSSAMSYTDGIIDLNQALINSAKSGLNIRVSQSYASAISSISKSLDAGAKMLADVSRQFAEAATGIADVDAYLSSKDLFKNAIDVITAPIKAQQDMLSGLSARSWELQSMIDNASKTNLSDNEIERIRAQLQSNTNTMISAYKAQKTFNQKYGVVISGAEQLMNLINSKTIDAGVARLPELISDYSSAFADVSQETNEALGLIVSTVNRSDANSVYGSFLRLNALYEDGALTASQYATVIETIEKVYEEGTDTIEKAYDRLKNAEKTYDQIAQERISLEEQLNQLTLTSDELRALELAKIDESNRYLQERIWQLLDEKAAQEEATKAQEEAAQAAENLRNAWTDATNSIQDEIDRILGIGSGNATTYQSAQAEFAQAQAMTLLGDIDAAKSLPELSRTMLELAENQVSSAEELALLKGQTAASLADTLGLIGAPYVSSVSATMTQLPSAPINQTQATNNLLVAELVAIKAELAEIKAQDKQVGVQLIKQTRTTADTLEKWDATGMPA